MQRMKSSSVSGATYRLVCNMPTYRLVCTMQVVGVEVDQREAEILRHLLRAPQFDLDRQCEGVSQLTVRHQAKAQDDLVVSAGRAWLHT